MKLAYRGAPVDPAQEPALRRSILLALSRFQDWIRHASLAWREEVGPTAGGTAVTCELRLRFQNGDSGSASGTGPDLVQALHSAAVRAARLSERHWSAHHPQLPPGRLP